MSFAKEMNVSIKEKVLVLFGVLVIIAIIWIQLAKIGRTMREVNEWMDSTNVKIGRTIDRMDSTSARSKLARERYNATLDSLKRGLRNLGAFDE